MHGLIKNNMQNKYCLHHFTTSIKLF